MISKKTKYALKILRLLGRRFKEEPIFVSEIVVQENIPQHYVESILVLLKRNGLVESTVRHGGGYLLLVPAGQITFLNVLEIIGMPVATNHCVASSFAESCSDCPQDEQCTLAASLKNWQAADLDILNRITIQDIL